MFYILDSGNSRRSVIGALRNSFFLVKKSYFKVLIFTFGIYIIVTVGIVFFTFLGVWHILDQETIQTINWETGVEKIVFEQLAGKHLFFLTQTIASSIFQILSSIFFAVLFYSLVAEENISLIDNFLKIWNMILYKVKLLVFIEIKFSYFLI